MTGFYNDTYGDLYGAGSTPATPPGPSVRPRLSVQMAFGSEATIDESGSGFFRLDSSVLDGTDVLGSVVWVEVADDVNDAYRVDISPGQTSSLESAAPSTCTVVVYNDAGDYDPLNLASPYAGQIDVGQPVQIRAVAADGTVTALWRGYIDEIVPDYGWDPSVTFSCSDGLAMLGRARLGEVAPSFDGDTTGTRIGRILDAALWPAGLRQLATGTTTVQADTFGDYALPLIQRILDTEVGALYVDGAGNVVFTDRLAVYTSTRSGTVQATFSDSGDDIEMQQLPAALRRGETWNEARTTREGGEEQVVVNAASQQKYGTQTYPGSVGTMARTDADAAAVASWLVARYSTPAVRFPEITVDATAQEFWTVLLALRRYDRVKVERDYGPVAFTRELIVEGIGHSITQDGWVMTFSTRDAESLTPFILDSSKLNGPNRLI